MRKHYQQVFEFGILKAEDSEEGEDELESSERVDSNLQFHSSSP